MSSSWEYKILDSREIEGAGRMKGASTEQAEAYLNALGADGWEVVHLDWRELEHRMSFMGLAKRSRSRS